MTAKAQGRTFWIVITAIIALVVLVILLVIFTRGTGKLEFGLMSCETKSGDCSVLKGGTCPKGFTESTVFDCKDTTKMCCLGTKPQ